MGGTQSSEAPVVEPDPILTCAYRVTAILDKEYPTVREHITSGDILAMAEDLRAGTPEEEIRARLDEIVKKSKEAFERRIMSAVPLIPIPR